MRVDGVGRLGKDPELRFSESGTPWFAASFAFECRVKKDGEWTNEPIWVDLKVLGKMAEGVASAANKGSRLLVTGKLEPNKYLNKEGIEVERLVLIADEVGLDLRFGLG
jgi:single-strand DNA-binding protein